MDNKLSHLTMLQSVITRLASNSFLLKAWTVTLVSALFALASEKTNPLFVYIAYIPIPMLWLLDGYFLRQERLFRKLYDKVRVTSDDSIDFSMDTSVVAHEVASWMAVCFSKTLIVFYGTIFGTVVLVMLILTKILLA